MPERHVDGPVVPGTANFRAIAPADVVRPGHLWRADGLSDLGEPGRAAIQELDLRTVVDLRDDVERVREPDDLRGLDLDIVACPVLDGRITARPAEELAELYVRILDGCGRGIATAVEVLAQPHALPAVVHCSAGKDRTGLVVALLLAALGVDDELVVRDYARSGDLLSGEVRARILRRAIASGLTEQQVAAAADSPSEAMRAALHHVRAAWGGPWEYLREHGVAGLSLERLRLALILPEPAQPPTAAT